MIRRSTSIAVAAVVALSGAAAAHDLERTQVSLRCARDGSFVLDVSNDAAWLKTRLASFPGPFADRVVLFVDGHEIRPTSVEYVESPGADAGSATVGTYRMTGRLPIDAHTLRWYYGLVVDPYPMTVHRADGRLIVEEVAGDAWSRTIDLSGQVQTPLISNKITVFVILGLFLVPIALRFKKATTV